MYLKPSTVRQEIIHRVPVPDVQLQEVKQLPSRSAACSSFRRPSSPEAHVQFQESVPPPPPPFSSAAATADSGAITC
jgi:hypothetical protein